MQSLFEKFIKGNCSTEEYEQVLKFIQNKKNDLQLDKLLHDGWAQHLKNEQTIKPDTKLLDSIHHQIAPKEDNPSRVIRIYQSLLSAAAILIYWACNRVIIFHTISKTRNHH